MTEELSPTLQDYLQTVRCLQEESISQSWLEQFRTFMTEGNARQSVTECMGHYVRHLHNNK